MAEQLSARRHTRHDEQFRVQFEPRGSRQAYDGVATNVGAGGMLLSSPARQPAGTRLRIRLLHPEHEFVVEGEVVHAKATHMGIRFLSTEELIAPLLLSEVDEGEVVSSEEELAAELGIYSVKYSNQQEFQLEYDRNLKVGGLVIETPYPAAIGTEVQLRVSVQSVPPQPVRLRGRVIAQFPSGIGVEITNLQTAGHDLLRLAGLSE